MFQPPQNKSIAVAFASLFLAFASSSFFLLPFFQTWHDQQRVAQISLTAFCALIAIFATSSLPSTAKSVLFTIFLLGGFSVVFSKHPLWALYEWATCLGLFFVAAVVCYSSVISAQLSTFIFSILALVTVVNGLQFITAYLTAILSGLHNFNAAMLFSGFSNPRFLNQFQALSLPILGYLFIQCRYQSFHYSKLLASIIFISLLTQWVIAFTLGGRGLWLAFTVSNLALIGFFPRYWRLLIVQLAAGLLAWLLYYMMFTVVPEHLGKSPRLWDNLRTGLSSREVLWQLAWNIFTDSPWLGAGPMHFSAYVHSVAAHPHQAVLQWLAEWGFFATLAAVALAALGMFSGLRYIRTAQSSSLDAALWMSLLNALVLAQVDGVFVMPYPLTWLAILAGLAWARWSTNAKATNNPTGVISKLAAIIAFSVCVHILFVGAPNYLKTFGSATSQQKDFTPRFWAHGFIPLSSSE